MDSDSPGKKPQGCAGQASARRRSLGVCPANPHGPTLGNTRLLQKYQPGAPAQIQLRSSFAFTPVNSFSSKLPKRGTPAPVLHTKSDCPTQKHQRVLLALARCQITTNESFPHSHLVSSQSQCCSLPAFTPTPQKIHLPHFGLRCNFSTTAGLGMSC